MEENMGYPEKKKENWVKTVDWKFFLQTMD